MSSRRFTQSESGAGAAEFAMVLPMLMFLLLGIINLVLMVYAQANLHSATEATARYYSVQTAATGTAPTTIALNTEFLSYYKGPNISAQLSPAPSVTGTCGAGGNTGHRVTGIGTYKLNYGFGHLNVPLSAAACFP